MRQTARKGGEEFMARYQTRLAELLEKNLGLPTFAKIDFDLLGAEMGLSGKVVREWYEAALGSDAYIGDHRRSTSEKIMEYLGVTDINELVIRVDSPHEVQESVSSVATMAMA
jgi:hypothetical protein